MADSDDPFHIPVVDDDLDPPSKTDDGNLTLAAQTMFEDNKAVLFVDLLGFSRTEDEVVAALRLELRIDHGIQKERHLSAGAHWLPDDVHLVGVGERASGDRISPVTASSGPWASRRSQTAPGCAYCSVAALYSRP